MRKKKFGWKRIAAMALAVSVVATTVSYDTLLVKAETDGIEVYDAEKKDPFKEVEGGAIAYEIGTEFPVSAHSLVKGAGNGNGGNLTSYFATDAEGNNVIGLDAITEEGTYYFIVKVDETNNWLGGMRAYPINAVKGSTTPGEPEEPTEPEVPEHPENVTVVFAYDAGNIISSTVYAYGADIVVPENPTKDADDTYTYAFAGWTLDGAVVGEFGTATADVTYYASFTAAEIVVPGGPEEPEVPEHPETVTVVFAYDAENIISSTVYAYGDTIVAPQNPTKTADDTYTYAFKCWTLDGAEVGGFGTATADVTYYANFEATEITPGGSTTPGEPEGPTEPTTPGEPEGPTEPTTPGEPEGPTEPTTPGEPEGPTEPTTPEVPEVPAEPTTPEVPEVPTEPTTPEVPEVPTEPTTPEVPEVPTTPEVPTNPTVPTMPYIPAAPVEVAPVVPAVVIPAAPAVARNIPAAVAEEPIVIEEEEVPLGTIDEEETEEEKEVVVIEEEEVPLGAEEDNCIIHLIMLVLTFLFAVYSAVRTYVRARENKKVAEEAEEKNMA